MLRPGRRRRAAWWAGIILGAAAARGADPNARGSVSLTLIPPSPVTDRIVLDIRGAVRNPAEETKTFAVAFFLDQEEEGNRIFQDELEVPGRSSRAVMFRWPAQGHAGRHRIIFTAAAGGDTARAARPIEIFRSPVRSTGKLGGAWVGLYHWSEKEGRLWNAEIKAMTDADWRALVRAMHAIGLDAIVIQEVFRNQEYYGKHAIERDGYRGRAFYPSKLYPARMEIAAEDPVEAILSEADALEMDVFLGVGLYAWFDFTPGSLAWHKRVVEELWGLYGHHPSLYGWYVSEEIEGSLGGTPERWREIAEFFRGFAEESRRLAPDKPILLAPNSHFMAKAEAGWRAVLENCDIVCPFGFHRMPEGDVTGETAAKWMQDLCDGVGAHLWMDLEVFLFGAEGELFPRPIGGLASDLSRFPTFEKILCYQFPGLMNAPDAPRKPGGEATVRLYEDYRRFLAREHEIVHRGKGKPAKHATAYDARYPGGGDAGLTDGVTALGADYRDPAWQGYWRDDLDATIDLGARMTLKMVRSRYLQQVESGIFVPAQVEYAISDDGETFRVIATVRSDVPAERAGPLTKEFATEAAGIQGRFVRVRAKSCGTIPAWHRAGGEKAWLFVDEIVIE